MLNPYVILAIVLAIAGAGVGGYVKGDRDATNAAIAAQKKAVDDAITEHNKDTIIDMQAAYERGQAEAKVKVITRTIQGEANAISQSKPIPAITCRLDDGRFRLLQRAVSVANGDADAPGGVPDKLPANKPSGIR